MSKKGRQFCEEKNRGDSVEQVPEKVVSFWKKKGVTPSVPAPGDANPSDATVKN